MPILNVRDNKTCCYCLKAHPPTADTGKVFLFDTLANGQAVVERLEHKHTGHRSDTWTWYPVERTVSPLRP